MESPQAEWHSPVSGSPSPSKTLKVHKMESKPQASSSGSKKKKTAQKPDRSFEKTMQSAPVSDASQQQSVCVSIPSGDKDGPPLVPEALPSPCVNYSPYLGNTSTEVVQLAQASPGSILGSVVDRASISLPDSVPQDVPRKRTHKS